MTSLIWIAAAVLLTRLTDRGEARVAALWIACVGGTTLPDIDFLLPLTHRSALTHSVLPLWLLWQWRASRPISGGAAVGVALHLSADCFPNGMIGYATVKLPLFGSIGASASYLWLGINAVVAMGAGVVLSVATLSRIARVLAMLGFAVIGIAYLSVTDGGWPPLAIFAVTGWLAVRRRNAAHTA